MTPPTPAELREAATLLRNWFIQSSAFPDDKDEAIYTLATHYLSHFPADSATPITADWLREEFGFRDDCCWESDEEDVEQSLEDTGCYKCIDPIGVVIWCDATGLTLTKDGETETIVDFPITTRQQFRDLARLLGIEPKRKESND